MQDFDKVIEQFRNKELNIEDWNFCTAKSNGRFDAYIMAEGAEQCLTCKYGFSTKQDIFDLYHSLGVTRILPI